MKMNSLLGTTCATRSDLHGMIMPQNFIPETLLYVSLELIQTTGPGFSVPMESCAPWLRHRVYWRAALPGMNVIERNQSTMGCKNRHFLPEATLT